MEPRLKCLPATWETWVRSLGREDPLEKEMAIHFSTIAWKTPWTEEPGRLQSINSATFPLSLAFLMSLFPFKLNFQSSINYYLSSLVAQTVKRLSTMWETRVRSLGREDPLEKEMAIHSSTGPWKVPWTEEPGRLQSMGSQRVGHD